jgi:hypothetical protein
VIGWRSPAPLERVAVGTHLMSRVLTAESPGPSWLVDLPWCGVFMVLAKDLL